MYKEEHKIEYLLSNIIPACLKLSLRIVRTIQDICELMYVSSQDILKEDLTVL